MRQCQKVGIADFITVDKQVEIDNPRSIFKGPYPAERRLNPEKRAEQCFGRKLGFYLYGGIIKIVLIGISDRRGYKNPGGFFDSGVGKPFNSRQCIFEIFYLIPDIRAERYICHFKPVGLITGYTVKIQFISFVQSCLSCS